jgi:CO dehydrogenase maturation factor
MAVEREHMVRVATDLKNKTQPGRSGIRIVITGKGGVGKTTLTATLARLLSSEGRHVLAVDADPQQNLAYSLGYPIENTRHLLPLSENFDYIGEKVGARPGEGDGRLLCLTPDVSDVVERFGVHISDGIDLLVMGTIRRAGGGCLCPENTLLESVIRYIRLREGEIILLDTQAGVEHFGRSIAGGFLHSVVLAEPSFNSLSVAKDSARFSAQLLIPSVHLVVNKTRHEKDRQKALQYLGNDHPFSSVWFLPWDDQVTEHEPDVRPLLTEPSRYVGAVKRLAGTLIKP